LLLGLIPLAGFAEEPNAAAQAARADIKAMFGFVPAFLNGMPDSALPGAWEEMKTIQMSSSTALPPKIKEAIGLAVAAQVPCKYCTYAHRQFGKLNGATDAELNEAVVMAALTRHWSTVLQGLQIDMTRFRAELTRAIDHAKKMAAGGPGAAPKPVNVVDARTALQDIAQSYGMVPEFMARFPTEGIAGAWKEDRDVEMNPATALSGKYKSLIGLAVAAQIPCRYCVAADTEFAKLEGATDREISEAVAMAALTRHWSTYLNGIQMDENAFRKDVDHLVAAAKKMAVAAAKKQASSSALAAKTATPPAQPTAAATVPGSIHGATAAATPTTPTAQPARAPATAAVAVKPATPKVAAPTAPPVAGPAAPVIAKPATPTVAAAPAPAAPANTPTPAAATVARTPAAPAKPTAPIATKPTASSAASAKPAAAATPAAAAPAH
jgi:AhpD family alkylhydroperoxidase